MATFCEPCKHHHPISDSWGFLQAVEAKEGVEIQNETITLASISYQNFFRSYPVRHHLSRNSCDTPLKTLSAPGSYAEH